MNLPSESDINRGIAHIPTTIELKEVPSRQLKIMQVTLNISGYITQ